MWDLTSEAWELAWSAGRWVSRRTHQLTAGVHLGLHLLLWTGIDFGHQVYKRRRKQIKNRKVVKVKEQLQQEQNMIHVTRWQKTRAKIWQWTLLSDILVSSVKLVFSVCPCCTWHVFINELLVFVLQLLPTLQICDVLDLLGGGSGSLQLLKDTLYMVPFLHVSCWLAERVRHDLPYPHYALRDFVFAFLTACSASFGVLHQEPLLCHVWLCGETLMEGRLGRSTLDESVLIEYQWGVVECNSWKGSTHFQELLTPDRCSESL